MKNFLHGLLDVCWFILSSIGKIFVSIFKGIAGLIKKSNN